MRNPRWVVLPCALAFLLAACSAGDQDPNALSPADEAKAQAMLARYEQARRDQNWEAAEAAGVELRQRYPDSPAATTMRASLDEVTTQAKAVVETRRLRALWDYQAVAVPGGVQRTAAIYSRTPPVDEGEPLPQADAQLVLRDHPSWGRSAYLLLAQKRFACGAPCAMEIAFDDAPAMRFAGKQADSGQGPALFIVERDRFVDALAKARIVRVILPKGSGLVSSLSFEVGGFEPTRFARP